MVSKKRRIKDVRRLFRQAKEIGGRPDVIRIVCRATIRRFIVSSGTGKRDHDFVQGVGIEVIINNNRLERPR